MLRRHSQVFITMLFCVDLALTFLAGIIAYQLRYMPFVLDRIPVRGVIPEFAPYLKLTLAALPLAAIAYQASGLYAPRRVTSIAIEWLDIAKASAFVLVALITSNFFLKGFDYSRGVLAIFFMTNLILLGIARGVARELLHMARARGWNQRRVIIVGSGRLAQILAARILENRWTGFEIAGFVDPRPERRGRVFHGLEVIGGLADLGALVDERHIDQVFVALPFSLQHHLPDVLEAMSAHHSDIRVVPDTFSFATLNKSIDDFAGLPIINLRESPLYGWNRLAKRGFDILLSALILLLLSPALLTIALVIKLGSPGPVLYRQERMGLDGRLFWMLKFRSMKLDAEAESGAVWARAEDPRRTRFGSFLRRTSLDELPQLWNVMIGDMSLVGPRPERPVFISEFKRTIPGYMLRHKVKAGMTGWAQVNGWRGNTSLRKRIQYDLDYIERWSLAFDFKILFLTALRGFVSPNAY